MDFFFLFVCFRLRNDDSADLKILDNRGEMDTWFRKKFILVRPFPREMSLKFAVSSVRNIVPSGTDTKVGKSAFGRARFNAPFCTRCTHTHTYTVNEVTKIHPVNRVRDATSPQKGSKLSFFYFSIEKNINISGIRFQKSAHTLILLLSLVSN